MCSRKTREETEKVKDLCPGNRGCNSREGGKGHPQDDGGDGCHVIAASLKGNLAAYSVPEITPHQSQYEWCPL